MEYQSKDTEVIVEYDPKNIVQEDGSIILPITKLWVNGNFKKGAQNLSIGSTHDLLSMGLVLNLFINNKGESVEKPVDTIDIGQLQALQASLVDSLKSAVNKLIDIDLMNNENRGEF
ncbi:MAG TPA: hypothetical protein ENH85_12415 [Candidatus Scalindua sp.]|nr:hypothetical protein [Candidatus Scalindua sp.]